MLRNFVVSAAAMLTLFNLTGCAGLLHGMNRGNASAQASKGPLSPGDPGYLDPGPFAGPLAQKDTGKVVFSGKPIAIQDTDDSSAFAAYTLGEPLYIRFFEKDSAHNLLPKCRSPREVIRVDLNGDGTGKLPDHLRSIGSFIVGEPKTRGGSTLTKDVKVPMTTPTIWTDERETAANAVIRSFNSGVVPKLKEGSNTLRVLISLDCGASQDDDPVIAEGTLAIDVAAGAMKTYLAKYGTQLMASPHPENAKLVPQILKAMKSKPDWDNEDFLGARVTSADWQPIRNQDTGVLVAKQIEAVIVVHSKKESDPNACRLFPMSYARDAAGGVLYYNGTGNPTPFPCANAPRS